MNPLALFTGPYAMLAKWAIIGIVVLGAFITGWVKGNIHGTEKLYAYQAKQATEAARIVVKQGAVTEKVLTKYIKVKGDTEVITNTVEKEVIRYEQAKLDQCPLSVAAVSLHNSAALNKLPDPASSVDGTPSGVKAAALTKTCTENYATYHKTANRLRGLQEWVREQEAVKP